MDDHYIKSTKVNDDNNNTNKITSVTNLDISTSSYINEIAELQSLISEYDKLNAISNKSKPKTNVNNNKIVVQKIKRVKLMNFDFCLLI